MQANETKQTNSLTSLKNTIDLLREQDDMRINEMVANEINTHLMILARFYNQPRVKPDDIPLLLERITLAIRIASLSLPGPEKFKPQTPRVRETVDLERLAEDINIASGKLSTDSEEQLTNRRRPEL